MKYRVRALAAAAAATLLPLASGCELGEPVEDPPDAVLPHDWPAAFPAPPPGAELVEVTQLAPGDNPGAFAHLDDVEVAAYYLVGYEIDESDIVALFTYYEDAFAVAGWDDLEIADDPRNLVVTHTGFTFHGYGVRGHLGLFTESSPAGITVDMQFIAENGATGSADGSPGGQPADRGVAGALPDDWPDQFPDPPSGATFNGYLGAAAGDRSEYLATYTLDAGALDDVHAYYLDVLTSSGWDLTEGLSVVSDVTTMTPFSGFGAEGSVTVQQDRPGERLTITIIMHIQR
jgi:hypothetical protein